MQIAKLVESKFNISRVFALVKSVLSAPENGVIRWSNCWYCDFSHNMLPSTPICHAIRPPCPPPPPPTILTAESTTNPYTYQFNATWCWLFSTAVVQIRFPIWRALLTWGRGYLYQCKILFLSLHRPTAIMPISKSNSMKPCRGDSSWQKQEFLGFLSSAGKIWKSKILLLVPMHADPLLATNHCDERHNVQTRTVFHSTQCTCGA